jgi:3-oxoacid CoA-transferase subunit A
MDQSCPASPEEVMAGLLHDGMTLMSGGFGPCGVPMALIRAVLKSGARELTIIAIDAGQPDYSVGLLISAKRVSKLVAAFVGANPLLVEQMNRGEIDVEFSPMGTLVERIRSGGAGIPAFYTKTGHGTPAATGKECRQFGTEFYLMETALRADVALVRAHTCDPFGNLCYSKTARNSNPVIATAADIVIAEVQKIGEIEPDQIHTPGIFVDRVVLVRDPENRIEHRCVRGL